MAYPIGGTGEDQFFIIELHYDNPNNVEGKHNYNVNDQHNMAGVAPKEGGKGND